MKDSPRLIIAVLFGATFMTTTLHAETKLSWKLKKGETIHYLVTRSTQGELMLAKKGEKLPSKPNIKDSANWKVNITWKVNKVNEDGSFDITHTVNRIQYTLSLLFQGNTKNPRSTHFKWDSASKKEQKGKLAETAMNSLRPMVGAKIGITLAPDGTLRSIKIPKKITKVFDETTGMIYITMDLENIFSANGIREMIEAPAGVFPNNPVKAGDSWKDKKEQKR